MTEISCHPADFAYKNLLMSLENRKVSSSVPANLPCSQAYFTGR